MTPSQTLEITEWLRPCVYAWKREDRYLYIGKSMRGVARPFGSHEIVKRFGAFEIGDKLELWHIEGNSARSISRLECDLISALQPFYNRKIRHSPERSETAPRPGHINPRESRYQKKEQRDVVCPECKAAFTTARDRQIYCRPKCRIKGWDRANPRQKVTA